MRPQTSRKQFSFASMKPPFGGGGDGDGVDYHDFPAADRKPNRVLEEAVVVKTPPLKRKSEMAQCEVASAEQNMGPGNAGVVKGLPRTPVSRKVPRTTKANIGSPTGNNLTLVGPCCYDSSLGLLTKKFINLIKHAEDGILDLNKAADTLEEEIENLNMEEHRLDECIRWLFVTEEDIKNLPCFQSVDYPQRRFSIVLRSTMGPIDVYLISQFEEIKEAQPNVLEASSRNENAFAPASMEETRGNDIDIQGIEAQRMCSDTSTSEDFVSGLMKITPNVDSDADYWLLTDTDYTTPSSTPKYNANALCRQYRELNRPEHGAVISCCFVIYLESKSARV
ncbi:UNVERIFIED_CONTAM: Transcription factor E2FB [Sesamum calycinum]|uniref:Transcription factor E2FB n=1 Tax=Sesamum calycinum TaxID=2727403 RepID=A0AAW2SE48_9LAMI